METAGTIPRPVGSVETESITTGLKAYIHSIDFLISQETHAKRHHGSELSTAGRWIMVRAQ